MVHAERLTVFHEASGVHELSPKVQAGNATKCGFTARCYSAHVTLYVLEMCKNLWYLEFCRSKTEIAQTQLFADGVLPEHAHSLL